jgi:hypothetical protein
MLLANPPIFGILLMYVHTVRAIIADGARMGMRLDARGDEDVHIGSTRIIWLFLSALALTGVLMA